jgi:hypothetical protein
MNERSKSFGVAQLSGMRSGGAAASERQAVIPPPTERSLIARFPASFFAIGLGTSSKDGSFDVTLPPEAHLRTVLKRAGRVVAR